MPDPNSVSPGAIGGRLDFSNAPGADQDWDSLFPNPELPTALSPQATQGTTPQQPATSPAQSQPFLKAGNTVYNTAEDAITGTVHKDEQIAKMRDFLKQNGIDPNTLQRVAAAPQATQPTPPSTERFYDKVAAAATNHDKDAYEAAMKEFFSSIVDPWRPTLAEMNRFKAFQQVSRELPGFKEFYENGEYQNTLEKNPLFKDMDQIGQNDPVAAQRLPEVYRSAYFMYKGSQPVQQATQAVTQNNPTVQQRPTLQNSSLTPPAQSANTQGWAETSWRGTKSLGNEARKQLIKDGDNKFQGMRFEDVGL